MTARRWRQADGIHERRFDDELFLVDPSGAEVFVLDPIGAGIWQVLAEPCDQPTLTETLALAFPDQPDAVLAADVDRLLAALALAGLIVAD